MKTPKIPRGWRLMTKDEIIKRTDRWFWKEWLPTTLNEGCYIRRIRKPRKGKKELKSEAARLDLEYLNAMHDQLIEQKRQLRDVIAQILSYGSGHESPDDYKWEYAPIPQCALDRAREILKQTK